MSITLSGGLNMPYRVKMHTVPAVPTVTVDQLFRRHLITGNGSGQAVPSIDFTGKGGLVISKARNIASYYSPVFSNSIRGGSKQLYPNSTSAESGYPGVTAYSKDGFSLGTDVGYNENGRPYVFFANKAAPGFFFMQQYTGNGTAKQIDHGLGMMPGMFVIKRVDAASDWIVWHASMPQYLLRLNTNGFAQLANGPNVFGNNTSFVAPNATTISLGNHTLVNVAGATYMIYGWANNPSGFVRTGSSTTSGSGLLTINTGWAEGPQFVLYKKATDTNGGNWNYIYPTTAKNFIGGTPRFNIFNGTQAEASPGVNQDASGVFTNQDGAANQPVIWMAIRAPKT